MRPKKKILIFSADEDELGRVGYLLWTRHYEPNLACTGKLALMAAAGTQFDGAVVLAMAQPIVAEDVARALAGAWPEMPLLLVAPGGKPLDAGAATRVLTWQSNAEMLEALRLLTVRKRGPKKAGSRYQVKNVDLISSDLQRVG